MIWPQVAKYTFQSNGYIAQWLERLTADQQVPGSNPREAPRDIIPR